MNASLLRRLAGGALRQNARPNRPQTRKSTRLGLETLEDRRFMTVFPTNVIDDVPQPVENEIPASLGTIFYDDVTRSVTVQGSNDHNDRIRVRIDTRGTVSTDDDQLAISISNANGTRPLTAQFNYAAVGRVFAHGLGGNDTIHNDTIVPISAFGGLGRDVLIGGYGNDVLRGGDDHDYLDGRRGNDTLWGELGNDVMFGDDGHDKLFGGAGYDFLFGGNGNDTLCGEGNDDWMYGGAGTDTLDGGAGAGTVYSDYGPDTDVLLHRFTAFDWFDRNLTSPDLRSHVRLQFRDGLLDRNDMLTIYATVSADNFVSSAELSDLKDLVSTKINTPNATRFFADAIANGDRANRWYRGGNLGNLYVGTHGSHLSKLVDKWFKGGDLPGVGENIVYTYTYGELFVNGPSHLDVNQGAVGDCYFLAALGEVAQHKPSIIEDMFSSNYDGTFTVRFVASGETRYVTVNRLLPVWSNSRPVYANFGSMLVNGSFVSNRSDNANNELWVALAEKAYAQLNESDSISQDGTNTYEGIAGGHTSTAFDHITGKDATVTIFSANLIAPSSRDLLLYEINQGKAITLSTKSSTADGIVSRHAYILVGYDAATEKFELFNPWGFTNGDPTLHLTWNQIMSNFTKSTSVLL